VVSGLKKNYSPLKYGMKKVSLRLLTRSALNNRSARMFDEAMKRRRSVWIIRRRTTKIAENTAF
jgi:hypothetical protein